MRPIFIFRLVLDVVAVSLLLAAYAYDGFGNTAHEMMGTCLFVLLLSHNIFNRRWYGSLARNWREPRKIFSRAITLSLLLTMIALLVTSVIVSQTVFGFLPVQSTFTLRKVHALVAYLVLFIAALHLGLQWSRIMKVVEEGLGVAMKTRLVALGLRTLAALIAICGVHSLFVIDVGSKLLMEITFGFWDFEAAAIEFVLRHCAIVGLCAAMAHYGLKFLGLHKRAIPRSADGRDR